MSEPTHVFTISLGHDDGTLRVFYGDKFSIFRVTKDSKIEPTMVLGIHTCGGNMRFVPNVNSAHSAIVCDTCHLRHMVAKTIVTFTDLEDAEERAQPVPSVAAA